MTEDLTPTEKMRVECVLLNQALCEMIHAFNQSHEIPAQRREEIYALAKETNYFQSDESNNRAATRATAFAGLRSTDHALLLKALREMVSQAEGRSEEPTETRCEEIYALANTGSPVCSTLANDEESTDDELVAHFVQELGMRDVEAREHLKQRTYLRQFMPGQ